MAGGGVSVATGDCEGTAELVSGLAASDGFGSCVSDGDSEGEAAGCADTIGVDATCSLGTGSVATGSEAVGSFDPDGDATGSVAPGSFDGDGDAAESVATGDAGGSTEGEAIGCAEADGFAVGAGVVTGDADGLTFGCPDASGTFVGGAVTLGRAVAPGVGVGRRVGSGVGKGAGRKRTETEPPFAPSGSSKRMACSPPRETTTEAGRLDELNTVRLVEPRRAHSALPTGHTSDTLAAFRT